MSKACSIPLQWCLKVEIDSKIILCTGMLNRPKRTWREVVEKDCEACKLNKEDVVDRSRWKKLIKDVR